MPATSPLIPSIGSPLIPTRRAHLVNADEPGLQEVGRYNRDAEVWKKKDAGFNFETDTHMSCVYDGSLTTRATIRGKEGWIDTCAYNHTGEL